MFDQANGVPHPGVRIKSEVIPSGMSVKKAAEQMGVSRPALSNLLNGNASLSAEMATRIEKAFKYPRETLMEMQAHYDTAQAMQKIAPSDTKAYVPPFLAIKANDIENWVSHDIPARSRLAVFLRTLVHSTNGALKKVEFHGNDDAERPGWDGLVEASEHTPWVPSGHSGWEFGTDDNIKRKADGDFDKAVKALDRKEHRKVTFVFVTPRRWAGKKAWVDAKKAKRLWKDVRAYDSSDLEQWVEQSLPGQAWFANETKIFAHDVRSLDKCWDDWANVSTPPLSGTFFDSAVHAAKSKMLAVLSKPSDGPTIIAADSTEEALAFVAQLLGERGGEDLAAYRDRVLVFDKPGVLPRLSQGAQSFIPVVLTREVERELAPYAKSMHAIIVYPRNATNTEPQILLEPVNYETFKKGLEDMGKDRDEILRLDNESGRSLTVLRRRLATMAAVRTPHWAADHKMAMSLVPCVLVGAWQNTNVTDCNGLSLLAGDRPYEEIEKEIQRLTQLNDAPVWSIRDYRGIVSKIDLLYAIAGVVTSGDLKRYFDIARMVLGEDDPALDLNEDKRWAASIYGKTREFSGTFREGICETLVLLAVHGTALFKNRLGIDPELEAALVVRELLPTPLTTRIFEANNLDLPTYAEAAPDEFLSILERDLKAEPPACIGLLRPVNGVFGQSPKRTGLLWALEGLAWNPQTFQRAVFILARLAQIEINDNWSNKPVNSLRSIFRAWMPQTAATHDERVNAMKKLAERFPDVSWKICVAQFGTYDGIGDYSQKPRWRNDGFRIGNPFQRREPIIKFQREMVEMALNWKDHSFVMLSDLIERLQGLDDRSQDRIWTLVETWATNASDADRGAMREKIRVVALSRRAAVHAKSNARVAILADRAKAAYAALEPSHPINKYTWLFQNAWVEPTADDIEEYDESDFQKREERIQKTRVDAIREIRAQSGLSALLELAERGNAGWQVGFYAAHDVLTETEHVSLLQVALQRVLEGKKATNSSKNVIAGTLHAIPDGNKREQILKAVAMGLSDLDFVQLLLLAPFCKDTWKLVDVISDTTAQAKYWSEVVPDWIRLTDTENNEAVERLLKGNRPRAAFSCVRIHPEKFDSQLLFRLLSAVAAGGNEKSGEYMLENYHIEQTFKRLNDSPLLTLDQKAKLEFDFLEILATPRGIDGYGIPNLERFVEVHPVAFVQAIAWAFKRNDGAMDPDEFQVPQDLLQTMAERGYKLLSAVKRIPGWDDLGVLNADRLLNWISTVRQMSAELNRADIADVCIGELLANAPIGEDGVWPCEPVRQVIEEIQSESMIEGTHTGVYNARGAYSRGETGDQERQLAEKYRQWGLSLQSSHPYVSSKLLMQLARTYERQANREDNEAGIRRRLR